MTREEVKRYIGELKMYASSQGWDEEYQIACDVAMNELEQEHSDKQRYVVRGINNDKIEFIDKYSVRAFNRYIKFIKDSCKYEVLNNIRAEIESLERFEIRGEKTPLINGDKALEIIDKYKSESAPQESEEV